MRNVGAAFGTLTRNSSWAYFKILDLKIFTEMTIKEIKVRYAEFMTLLSMLERNVDMN